MQTWAVVVSVALALWRPINLVLDGVGIIDTVRDLMDPSHWLYKVLFWQHLGNAMTATGVLGVFALLIELRRHGSGGDVSLKASETEGAPPAGAPESTPASEQARRCLQVDPPDYIATGEWHGGERIPIGANGRLIIDVTDRPEAQVGMQYDVATGVFRQPPPKPVAAPENRLPLAIEVAVVPNNGAGGTPGAHIRVTNKETAVARSANLVITDLLLWQESNQDFAQTRDVYDAPFTELTTNLRHSLFCEQPQDLGFIRAEDESLRIDGSRGSGPDHIRARTAGIWKLLGRVVAEDGRQRGVSVCFEWDGKPGNCPKPVRCPPYPPPPIFTEPSGGRRPSPPIRRPTSRGGY